MKKKVFPFVSSFFLFTLILTGCTSQNKQKQELFAAYYNCCSCFEEVVALHDYLVTELDLESTDVVAEEFYNIKEHLINYRFLRPDNDLGCIPNTYRKDLEKCSSELLEAKNDIFQLEEYVIKYRQLLKDLDLENQTVFIIIQDAFLNHVKIVEAKYGYFLNDHTEKYDIIARQFYNFDENKALRTLKKDLANIL